MLNFIQVADLGLNRDKYLAKVTRTCGKGNWFWVFAIQKKLYSWEWGMQLYEDSFYEYFHKHPDLLKSLIQSYHDVFVLNRFDCESGLDYKKQNQNQDHYNDIAIRRCLTRFAISFKGKDLLELGGSPYCHSKVPFHLAHLLKSKDKSVKSWFNSSRLIAVAPEIEDKAKLSELLVR